jgi:opacity protein-like surface antigen
MTGNLLLTDGSQTLRGSDWTIDRSSVNVLAIEGETRLGGASADFSIGGEYLYYQSVFERTSAGPPENGKMYTRAFLAKSKYYFARGNALQPYVGVGLGPAFSDDLSVEGGPIRGTAFGIAYLGVVGVQLRSKRIGLRLEYTALHARPSDSNGETLDASTRGVLMGLSFFLGSR